MFCLQSAKMIRSTPSTSSTIAELARQNQRNMCGLLPPLKGKGLQNTIFCQSSSLSTSLAMSPPPK